MEKGTTLSSTTIHKLHLTQKKEGTRYSYTGFAIEPDKIILSTSDDLVKDDIFLLKASGKNYELQLIEKKSVEIFNTIYHNLLFSPLDKKVNLVKIIKEDFGGEAGIANYKGLSCIDNKQLEKFELFENTSSTWVGKDYAYYSIYPKYIRINGLCSFNPYASFHIKYKEQKIALHLEKHQQSGRAEFDIEFSVKDKTVNLLTIIGDKYNL